MNSASEQRERLIELLAIVEDPARATALQTDDPALVAVARRHRLSPLLSVVCAGTLPSGLAEIFRRDRVVTAARGMLLGQVAEECLRALAGAGISAIVLKGMDYEARLYPAVGARPTSDVDLLVPNEARREAFVVLDRLGFEPRAAAPGFDDADYHEVAWTRDAVEVDLHLGLAPFARCSIDYRAVWTEARALRVGQTETLALAPSHAATFHALHMAIDHFGVPALYLVDLARLLATPEAREQAEATARAWRCRRPLATALALTATFLPLWAHQQPPVSVSRFAARVVAAYGTTDPLPRGEQLLRKLAHFDTAADALRYLSIQSRRNIRERFERLVRRRSARERLAL